MLIKSIRLTNFLSFGEAAETVELKPLNVVIGPNGSGKSKAEYGKGEHSFPLLARIDPATVMAASPWAKRFVDELKKKVGA